MLVICVDKPKINAGYSLCENTLITLRVPVILSPCIFEKYWIAVSVKGCMEVGGKKLWQCYKFLFYITIYPFCYGKTVEM